MKLPWIVKFNQRFARKEIQISQWINFVIASCPGVWNILAWLLSSHLTSFQLSVMLSQDQHHRDEDCQRTKAAIKKLSFESFELNKQSIPGVSVISPAPSSVSQGWYTIYCKPPSRPRTRHRLLLHYHWLVPRHHGDGRVVITMVYWLLEDPAISQHLPQLSTELNLTLLHFWGDSRQDKAVLFISETSSALTNHLHWEL